MKVHQLISLLQQMPQDVEVDTCDYRPGRAATTNFVYYRKWTSMFGVPQQRVYISPVHHPGDIE
jgi:hypothetical protein